MLKLTNLNVLYGKTQVLWDVSMDVPNASMVALMGPNGSGKSTVFKAVTGMVRVASGSVLWQGADITNMPAHEMTKLGISLVLERRRLFPQMTVRENVLLGAYTNNNKAEVAAALRDVEKLLPLVSERANAVASSLSGGQQQVVAIARGLISRPKLLIMDEPFLGLSPVMVKTVMGIMKTVNGQGVSVLFNEQNAKVSFGNSDFGYVLESGRVIIKGTGLDMLEHPEIKRVYLGH